MNNTREWGYWNAKTNDFQKDGDREYLTYPLRSIAEAVLESQDPCTLLEVRPFYAQYFGVYFPETKNWFAPNRDRVYICHSLEQAQEVAEAVDGEAREFRQDAEEARS